MAYAAKSRSRSRKARSSSRSRVWRTWMRSVIGAGATGGRGHQRRHRGRVRARARIRMRGGRERRDAGPRVGDVGRDEVRWSDVAERHARVDALGAEALRASKAARVGRARDGQIGPGRRSRARPWCAARRRRRARRDARRCAASGRLPSEHCRHRRWQRSGPRRRVPRRSSGRETAMPTAPSAMTVAGTSDAWQLGQRRYGRPRGRVAPPGPRHGRRRPAATTAA